MQYQSLQMNNRQMEFSQWIEYLVKLICGVFLIDPSEINFEMKTGAGNQSAPLFMSGNEAKQKLSKDRGLKPLLKFIESEINKNVIYPLDNRFQLRFVGLDTGNEKDIQELRIKELMNFKTVDEIRAEYDLKPIGIELGGDLIMNPQYITWRTQKDMQAQMGGGGGEGGGQGFDFGEGGGGEGPPGEEDQGEPDFGSEPDFGKEHSDFGQEKGKEAAGKELKKAMKRYTRLIRRP
jgi:hypothetical protein